jgi:hypothetical protein
MSEDNKKTPGQEDPIREAVPQRELTPDEIAQQAAKEIDAILTKYHCRLVPTHELKVVTLPKQ